MAEGLPGNSARTLDEFRNLATEPTPDNQPANAGDTIQDEEGQKGSPAFGPGGATTLRVATACGFTKFLTITPILWIATAFSAAKFHSTTTGLRVATILRVTSVGPFGNQKATKAKGICGWTSGATQKVVGD